MKIFTFLTLFISISLFANINYKFFPANVKIFGYIAIKNIKNNKEIRELMDAPKAKESLKSLMEMGIYLDNLGAISFFADTESLKAKSKGNHAIILHGLNAQKLIEQKLKEVKNPKTETYKGYKIYLQIKNKNNQKKEEAATIINNNTIIGSKEGVKKAIDAYKGNYFKNPKIVKNALNKLNNPDFFVIDLVDKKQRDLFLSGAAQNQNPTMAMLNTQEVTKNLKILIFAGKLAKNKLHLYLALQSDKNSVKPFISNLNMQFRNFKPMLAQQINVYKSMVGNTGAKELNSILNSVKIYTKNDFGIISLYINLKRTIKALNEMNSKMKNSPMNNMPLQK